VSLAGAFVSFGVDGAATLEAVIFEFVSGD